MEAREQLKAELVEKYGEWAGNALESFLAVMDKTKYVVLCLPVEQFGIFEGKPITRETAHEFSATVRRMEDELIAYRSAGLPE